MLEKLSSYGIAFLIVFWLVTILVGISGINARLDKLIELCTFEEESEQIIFYIDPQELSIL